MSKVDINHADVETLAQLDGIGNKLAARIVAYRETVQPFAEIIELAAVPGISEQMVRALADEIEVTPGPTLADDVRVADEDADEVVAEETVVREPALEEPEAETEAPEPVVPSRRPLSCLGYLLTSVVGALLGAGLTLLLLYALNGTLDFASPLQIARLQSQVAEQSEGQSGLAEEVESLSARLSTVRAAEATTSAALAERTAALATTESELATLERGLTEDITDLERAGDALSTRVAGLSVAAEDFDLFLDGMRDLMIQLRGLPLMPTGTVTPSVTTTATVTMTARTPTPTATPAATRTPRPTATPLAPPTPTVVNSP